ncbi:MULTISPECIES: M48 family metallopeptidase [unclassified Roseofilum]|uniref:M48 family metallopeptidase n=1 Tax=unclassified Roseofilum TaxID=2620099 RepID=UPI001B205B90|nr:MULTISPECIES: M48 family metalloprotease [unclassified Roseofilum]MBP0009710.1 M48 family metalloprotease [Roseofilum sp. Belize Diploria]MBP0035096.1 M48 family metalloprotease [Roseofilum sp. Belize BBD 4]
MPTYTGISSEAFRHPLDWEAEQTLRSFPGFDLLARKFVEFLSERPQYIYSMGNYVQVGPRQYSTIYQLFREAVRDLDVSPEPGLFVSQNAQVNSYALGQDNPFIVINTGLLDLMTEGEIKTVLAHELGHIKCGHTILIQMAIWVMSVAEEIGKMTFGLSNVVISIGLLYAFYEWRRKAELSSDRAALLVTDDLPLVMNTMMKMAGGSSKYGHEVNLQEFIRQSQSYQDLDRDNLNQVYKFLLYNGGQGTFLSHPFPVDRLHYLQAWYDSPEYAQIRQGNYRQKTAEGSVNVDSEEPQSSQTEAEELRHQLEELQQEIERLKTQKQSNSSNRQGG